MREKPPGRIMVVDDDRELLTPLCDVISEIGYEVACFVSAEEALECFDREAFDLILVDLMMPQMDGIAFMKAAKTKDPLLVCIIVTGHATVKTAVEAMKEGAFDYMTKPLNWKTLRPVLSRAIEVRRLRKSEEQYRSVVEDQTELICRCLPDGTITFVNKAYCRYFGKTRAELIGQSYLPFIAVEDHERLKKHLASLSKENPVAVIENRVIAAGGATRWQQWTNSILFDEQGRAAEVQSIGRDITDRKAAEEKLKVSEEKYRLLIENVNESIVVAQDGMLKFVNSRAVQLLGYSKEEELSRPFIEFVHTDDREMVSVNYAKRMKGEELPRSYSFRVVTKDGVIKWLELSAVLFTWEGRPATLNFLSDITERKRIEKDLKQSEERYRQLVETMNEGMGVMDENARITFINESFCKILDYRKDEMIGRSVFDFIDRADHAVLKAQIKRREKGESGGYEIPWLRRNGQKIYTVVSPRSIFNESGQFKGSFAVLTDITERKKAEEELKKSHEQLRNFAKRLAEAEEIERQKIARELHDQVGQNLTALGINLSILRNQLSGALTGQTDARLNDSMSILAETAKKIRDVMSDLRPSVLDDYGLMAAIRWLSERISTRTGLTIRVEGLDTKVDFSSETEITLFRIAQELLTNITKHAKATEVSIRLESMDGRIQFIISDNGIGFDPTALGQTGESRWGLLNVRERTDAIDGILTIASRPGQGTRIVIEVKK
jgi:PAS domain S-box-containing protein